MQSGLSRLPPAGISAAANGIYVLVFDIASSLRSWASTRRSSTSYLVKPPGFNIEQPVDLETCERSIAYCQGQSKEIAQRALNDISRPCRAGLEGKQLFLQPSLAEFENSNRCPAYVTACLVAYQIFGDPTIQVGNCLGPRLS